MHHSPAKCKIDYLPLLKTFSFRSPDVCLSAENDKSHVISFISVSQLLHLKLLLINFMISFFSIHFLHMLTLYEHGWQMILLKSIYKKCIYQYKLKTCTVNWIDGFAESTKSNFSAPSGKCWQKIELIEWEAICMICLHGYIYSGSRLNVFTQQNCSYHMYISFHLAARLHACHLRNYTVFGHMHMETNRNMKKIYCQISISYFSLL